jgi:ABC-type Fe3+/spermidine/putrescine transport system ATPase subunit
VHLTEVSKFFTGVTAVDCISLTAQAGKLTTLLGPSGCGKTTTLRMIGGFYEPDTGEIRIGSKVVNTVPPYARSTRTVFQNYALFPHMSVFENVAFGLRASRVKRSDIRPRVNEALGLVGLAGLADRSPGQLSGGQQQRVAFARALVTRPEVLLLDEPLSNLDAKLRVHMRLEIRKLQQDLGITTIYVTHDQEEAMSLSDHVVVMNDGRIEQQGLPHDIYEKPASRFVADFIGTSNFVPAQVLQVNGRNLILEVLGKTLSLTAPERQFQSGDSALLVIRPEHLHLDQETSHTFDAHVESVSYLGAAASYLLRLADGSTLTVDQPAPVGATLHHTGDAVTVSLDTQRVYVIPK